MMNHNPALMMHYLILNHCKFIIHIEKCEHFNADFLFQILFLDGSLCYSIPELKIPSYTGALDSTL